MIYYTGTNTPAPDIFIFTMVVGKNVLVASVRFPLDIPCLSISADGINNHDLPAIVSKIDNPKGGIIAL